MNDEHLLRLSTDIQNLTHGLLAAQRRSDRPADVQTYTFTATRYTRRSDVGEGLVALSIGLLNPNPFAVYLGIGGNTPTAAGKSPSAPPKSLLVLPIEVIDMELGIDPADPVAVAAVTAADCSVFLMRFPTVQPAFLGAMP